MTILYNVVVKNRHVEGGNVAVMEFESANSTALPKIEAGAHIDVHLPNGMVRQYSLCQNPNDVGLFRLGILRDPESRGGSVSAFDDLKDSCPRDPDINEVSFYEIKEIKVKQTILIIE